MVRLFTLGSIVTGACWSVVAGQIKPPEPAADTHVLSAYVLRMMSLDRNADGFLSGEELPGNLADLMEAHDQNQDQKLSPDELAAVEHKARAARDTRQPQDQPVRTPAGRGGRRGPRQGNTGTQAKALDVEQILRFALTFDADRDGGLNADELRKYAAALAVRRAGGRGRQRAADPSQAKPPARGLGSPGSSGDPSKPFGAPAKGLGADGSGGGGFGDQPTPKKKK